MFCLSMFCRFDVLVIRCFVILMVFDFLSLDVLSVSHGKYI